MLRYPASSMETHTMNTIKTTIIAALLAAASMSHADDMEDRKAACQGKKSDFVEYARCMHPNAVPIDTGLMHPDYTSYEDKQIAREARELRKFILRHRKVIEQCGKVCQ